MEWGGPVFKEKEQKERRKMVRALRYGGSSVSSCIKLRSWSFCFWFYYFPVLWKEDIQQGTVQDGFWLKLQRNLNRQENEKSVITNAYVPLTGLQMLISHSPVFYLCTSPLDIFIFKYILLNIVDLRCCSLLLYSQVIQLHTHTHTHTHTLHLLLFSRSVVSDSVTHGLQHARVLCPSLSFSCYFQVCFIPRILHIVPCAMQ